MSIPVVDCPHCGPKCFAGAAHNARAEDGYMHVAPAAEVQDGGFEAWSYRNPAMRAIRTAYGDSPSLIHAVSLAAHAAWDAALASHAQGEQWVSVKDRLPRVGMLIEAFGPNFGKPSEGFWRSYGVVADDGQMYESDGLGGSDFNIQMAYATHWRLLDAPPTTGKAGAQ